MKIETFELERYFAKYEFSAQYMLSSSDCESVTMHDLIAIADEEMHDIWKNLSLGYTETSGHPMLRQCIADLYPEFDVEKLQVVVPQEGIFLVMHALLEREDHVVCTFPGYQSLYEVARSLGCKLDFWKPDETNGWRFDINQLKALLRPETRLVVINFPHNPTGWSPSPEEFIEICRTVERSGAYLLSDEMYRWLDIEPGTSLPSASERYERGLSLGGLSKSFGMPGLRLVVCPS